MEWLQSHSSEIYALFGGLTAVWGFLARIDKYYRAHLKEEFATKQDFKELRQDVREIRRALVGGDYGRRARRS